MPMYEYQCAKCHTTFEVLQKFSDEPLKKHQGCGGKVKKLLSAPSFHLKGSGWYVTDYAKPGSRSEPNSESKPTGSASETKSESKTETKQAETSSSDSSKSESKSPVKSKSAAKKDKD